MSNENIIQTISEQAAKEGVDGKLLIAVAASESGLNAATKGSVSGVQGIFQITQSTWSSYAKGMAYSTDVDKQAIVAARIIKDLKSQGLDTPDLIYAGYNVGPAIAKKIKEEMKRNGGDFKTATVAVMNRDYSSGVYYDKTIKVKGEYKRVTISTASKINEIISGASRVHQALKDGVKYSAYAGDGAKSTGPTTRTGTDADATTGTSSGSGDTEVSADAITSFFNQTGQLQSALSSIDPQKFGKRGAKLLRKAFHHA